MCKCSLANMVHVVKMSLHQAPFIHLAHPDQRFAIILMKNDLICAKPYLPHLWPALAPQTHLQKHPIIYHPKPERQRETDACYKSHSYSSVNFYWPTEGLQFIFNTEWIVCVVTLWYLFLSFTVVAPTIQNSANGAHPIQLNENKWTTPPSKCILQNFLKAWICIWPNI